MYIFRPPFYSNYINIIIFCQEKIDKRLKFAYTDEKDNYVEEGKEYEL